MTLQFIYPGVFHIKNRFISFSKNCVFNWNNCTSDAHSHIKFTMILSLLIIIKVNSSYNIQLLMSMPIIKQLKLIMTIII